MPKGPSVLVSSLYGYLLFQGRIKPFIRVMPHPPTTTLFHTVFYHLTPAIPGTTILSWELLRTSYIHTMTYVVLLLIWWNMTKMSVYIIIILYIILLYYSVAKSLQTWATLYSIRVSSMRMRFDKKMCVSFQFFSLLI